MKHWTRDDCERAVTWIENKSFGGTVWLDAEATDDDRLENLRTMIDDDDPAEFATELQSMLKPSAWKRMLGTLRQHKHKAEAAERAADEPAAASDDQPAESEQATASVLQLIRHAEQGDVQPLIEFLQLTLPAASMAAMRAAFGGDHQEHQSLDDDHQVDDHLEKEVDDHLDHQVDDHLDQEVDDHLENQADDHQADDLSALQIAAIALARQEMEQDELPAR